METWARLGVTIKLEPLEGETGYEYILRAIENRCMFVEGYAYFPEETKGNQELDFVGDDIWIPDSIKLMRIN